MKRIALIFTSGLIVLFTVCLLAGLPISTAVIFCTAGGLIGATITAVSTRLTGLKRIWTGKHSFLALVILQVLTASFALVGMIAETKLLDHLSSTPGGFTLLLWPFGVFVALIVLTTYAIASLPTTGRRVAAYSLAIVISLMHTYWHVFYIINKYGT
mgnify:CR=1 FL=1